MLRMVHLRLLPDNSYWRLIDGQEGEKDKVGRAQVVECRKNILPNALLGGLIYTVRENILVSLWIAEAGRHSRRNTIRIAIARSRLVIDI